LTAGSTLDQKASTVKTFDGVEPGEAAMPDKAFDQAAEPGRHPATIAYIERRIQEGKTDAKQTAASSATSPATSTGYRTRTATGDLTNIEASLAHAAFNS
jgi:hypothetical protein